MKSKLEYIWLDGFQPTQSLRSKTQMSKDNFTGALEDVAMWSFDGSSTEQAEGGSSDCLLKPSPFIQIQTVKMLTWLCVKYLMLTARHTHRMAELPL